MKIAIILESGATAGRAPIGAPEKEAAVINGLLAEFGLDSTASVADKREAFDSIASRLARALKAGLVQQRVELAKVDAEAAARVTAGVDLG